MKHEPLQNPRLHEIEHGGYESRREWMLHRFAYHGFKSLEGLTPGKE